MNGRCSDLTAGNTRASGGKGAATKNLYWFSAEYVGGEFPQPCHWEWECLHCI